MNIEKLPPIHLLTPTRKPLLQIKLHYTIFSIPIPLLSFPSKYQQHQKCIVHTLHDSTTITTENAATTTMSTLTITITNLYHSSSFNTDHLNLSIGQCCYLFNTPCSYNQLFYYHHPILCSNVPTWIYNCCKNMSLCY